MWLLLVLQLTWSHWVHMDPTNPRMILHGTWESCKEDDGTYGERIWDYVYPSKQWNFEFHMGPYHDFAFYRVQQDEEKHDHSDELNELKPHQVVVEYNRAHKIWNLKDVRIDVALTPGSYDRCETWFVTIEKKHGQ